jgi:hypothetical protein
MNNSTIANATIAVGIFVTMNMTACKKSDNTNVTTITGADTTMTDSARLSIFKKIYGATDVHQDGDYVVITTKDLPDHKTPYYKGTQWESTLYEAYNGSNTSFSLDGGSIAAQNLTFRIPLRPVVATTHSSTPLGPIGISLNGVVFFNQYNGQDNPLTVEINTFDEYNGHPAPGPNMYHYHVEPLWLTQNKGKDALLGFLLDGFPVYGPLENGKTLTSADLDAYHGHFGKTTEYPNGIYHYHTSSDAPYINGDGFYGTAGTISH